MTETLTNRVKAIKNDDAENVLIAEINSAFDKLDNSFIPAAKMHFTGVQTLTHNVTAPQDFNVVTHDTYAARSEGAMADLGSNRIVIRKAGVYVIAGSTGWASNATGIRRMSILINGTPVAHSECAPVNGGVTGTGVTTTEVLAANDIITLETVQTSGGDLGVSNGAFTKAIFLSAVWAGGAVEV